MAKSSPLMTLAEAKRIAQNFIVLGREHLVTIPDEFELKPGESRHVRTDVRSVIPTILQRCVQAEQVQA